MPVAPNACADTRNLPGPILAAAGIVAIALTLTTAGYGSLTWCALSALASVLCLRFGIGLMIIEHRRVKAAKRRDSARQDRI
ncbi:hypothetical protein GPX89_25520 [Nocardia sp. ET3-3]|uniref:Uncharacterized protein n=1 Tax=Nocardia terrae TaxID=2675851 RepID=A0A7K1V251_9NOCA|nr:hypothetical protein [Nocardia terrae]MVU80597.1 hypothetical protein [Nocardia terrae]